MKTKSIQTLGQAVDYIQSLPINCQQKMIDWINVFQSEIEKDELNTSQDFFEKWQAWHHSSQAFLDNDNSWADTKDKSDVGKEVVFE